MLDKLIRNTLFVILLGTLHMYSQNKYYIDSLSAKVKSEKSAYQRAEDYYLLFDETYKSDTGSSNAYWRKSLKESEAITDAGQKADFLFRKIMHDFNMHHYKECKTELDAISLKVKSNPSLAGKYHCSLGMYLIDNHTESDTAHKRIVSQFNKAIKEIGNSDNEWLAKAYMGLFYFYYQDKQREKLAELLPKVDSIVALVPPTIRAKDFHLMGRILKFSEYSSKAYIENKKALECYRLCRDSINIAGLMINLVSAEYDIPDAEMKSSLLKAIGILKRNASLNPDKTNQNMSSAYMRLAKIYDSEKDTVQCLRSFELAHIHNNKGGNFRNEPLVLGEMGNAYRRFGYLDSAMIIENKSLQLREKFHITEGIMYCYASISQIYLAKKDYREAITYANKAMKLSIQSGYHDYDDNYLSVLALAYSKTGDFKQAYDYQTRYYNYTDSMTKLHNDKEVYRLKSEEKEAEQQAEFNKKTALAKIEQEKRDVITASNSKRQKLYILFTLLIAAASGIVAYVVFRSLKITRRQKAEIEIQKELVQEKNKEILDSIAYAKRLQDAILPPLSLVTQCLPESFVLYRPKDIVAGDFYWMEQTDDTILIAAADCTGHGVPGALVSVVCSNALNRTVKEFHIEEPGKILNKVRELVLETFEKSEGNIQDGMDISMCCINRNTKEIQWSGANNALWYIHHGEMSEVPANKQPIGKIDNPMPFSTHNLSLQKGDLLYLFTDGYADQFGGPKGKKFKYKQLQRILMENMSMSMEEQKKVLEDNLTQWKGNLEQVDDVLIIGIKL